MSVEEIQSLRSEVATIRESVHRIELAITGQPALGQAGIGDRLKQVEAKADASDRKLLLWGGVFTGVSFVVSLAWRKIVG